MSALTASLTSNGCQVRSGVMSGVMSGVCQLQLPVLHIRDDKLCLAHFSASAVTTSLSVEMCASCICCSVIKCVKLGGFPFPGNCQPMCIVTKDGTFKNFGNTLDN